MIECIKGAVVVAVVIAVVVAIAIIEMEAFIKYLNEFSNKDRVALHASLLLCWTVPKEKKMHWVTNKCSSRRGRPYCGAFKLSRCQTF